MTVAPDSSNAVSAADPTPIVLYDGVCGLCDRFVQFVLKHDAHRSFRFAPLQGPFARQALLRHGLPRADIDLAPSSIVLLENPLTSSERVRFRSDAVLAILSELGGTWRLAVALRIIPRPLRDAVYSVFARVRYRLFGKFDSCAIPSAAGKGRFLT